MNSTPWLTIAKSYVGLKEIPGKLHNPTIIGWLKKFALNIGRWGKGRDETPWCAVFVSQALDAAGYRTSEDARAASYVTYGRPSKFVPGAVIVIKRKRKGADRATGSRAGYHVGFLIETQRHYYKILGGNQRNRVSVALYSKKGYDVKAIRWPVVASPGKRAPSR